MKFLLSTALTVFSATLAVAAPSLGSDVQTLDKILTPLAPRDGIETCNECAEHLDMCMTYGTAKGIDKCEDICMSRLCKKWPDCHDCDEKYDHCTERDV